MFSSKQEIIFCTDAHMDNYRGPGPGGNLQVILRFHNKQTIKVKLTFFGLCHGGWYLYPRSTIVDRQLSWFGASKSSLLSSFCNGIFAKSHLKCTRKLSLDRLEVDLLSCLSVDPINVVPATFRCHKSFDRLQQIVRKFLYQIVVD